MRWLLFLIPAVLVSPACLLGQRVSFGLVGGTNLTRDFSSRRVDYQDSSFPAGLTTFETFSNTHSWIAGFSTEIQIGSGLSFEANALHRSLNLKQRSVFPDGSVSATNTSPVTTWEFPLLLKYRLPGVGGVHPFVEGGPSFRTRHNPGATEPSQFGATIGAGVEYRAGRIRISPGIRYTRWHYEGIYPRYATKPDQLEFVTGISYGTSLAGWKVGSRKLRFGVVAGTSFTDAVSSRGPGERMDELQAYIAGLAFEVEAHRRFSLVVNGLYRPFRTVSETESAPPGLPPQKYRNEFTIVTWQIPVLVKYSFASGAGISPFVEAGPSFRLSGNLNGANPSWAGITAGVGFQKKYNVMKIGPEVRYTRWANDPAPILGGYLTKPNQLELLVSATF